MSGIVRRAAEWCPIQKIATVARSSAGRKRRLGKMDEEKPKDPNQKTWNSKLIISLAGIGSTTLLAALGVISGGAAVPVILSIIAGYGAYRAVSLK